MAGLARGLAFVLLGILVPTRSYAQELSLPPQLLAGDRAFAALDDEGALRHYEAARDSLGGAESFELLSRLSHSHTHWSLDLIARGDRKEAEVQIDRALDEARILVERYPDRAESWFLLAIAIGNQATFKGGREKVRYGRAVEEYSLRALGLDSTHVPTHVVLGVFYREVAEVSWLQRLVANTLFGGLPRGSYELSEQFLRKAIELDPRAPLAQFELGRTLYYGGHAIDALPHLLAGAELKPTMMLDARNATEALRLARLIVREKQDCGASSFVIDIRERTVDGIPVDRPLSALTALLGENRVDSTTEDLEGEPSPMALVDFCGHTVERHWNGLSWTDPAFRTTEGLAAGMPIAAFDSTYGMGSPTWSEAGVVVGYPVDGREFYVGIDQDCVAQTDAMPPDLRSRECEAGSIWIPLQTMPE